MEIARGEVPEPEPEAKVDDEDTLSGLDPVPAVDTAVISADAVEEQLQQLEPEPEPEPAPEPATPPRSRAGGSRRWSRSS